MVQRFTDRVNPWLMADQGKILKGRLPLDSFPRLLPLLMQTDGAVAFSISFGKDRRRRILIDSSVDTRLFVQCQRCLEAMPLDVSVNGRLAVVQGVIEAEQLPEELDPLILDEKESLVVGELIEDELILALPVSPRHATNCVKEDYAAEPTEPEETLKNNPFAMLERLKSAENDS